MKRLCCWKKASSSARSKELQRPVPALHNESGSSADVELVGAATPDGGNSSPPLGAAEAKARSVDYSWNFVSKRKNSTGAAPSVEGADGGRGEDERKESAAPDLILVGDNTSVSGTHFDAPAPTRSMTKRSVASVAPRPRSSLNSSQLLVRDDGGNSGGDNARTGRPDRDSQDSLGAEQHLPPAPTCSPVLAGSSGSGNGTGRGTEISELGSPPSMTPPLRRGFSSEFDVQTDEGGDTLGQGLGPEPGLGMGQGRSSAPPHAPVLQGGKGYGGRANRRRSFAEGGGAQGVGAHGPGTSADAKLARQQRGQSRLAGTRGAGGGGGDAIVSDHRGSMDEDELAAVAARDALVVQPPPRARRYTDAEMVPMNLRSTKQQNLSNRALNTTAEEPGTDQSSSADADANTDSGAEPARRARASSTAHAGTSQSQSHKDVVTRRASGGTGGGNSSSSSPPPLLALASFDGLNRHEPNLHESGLLVRDIVEVVFGFLRPVEIFRIERTSRVWRQIGRAVVQECQVLDVSGQDAQISEAALRRVATRCPTLREIKLGACPSVRAFSSCMARVLSLCPTMRVLHLCAVPFERSIVGRAVGLEVGNDSASSQSTRTSKEDAPADEMSGSGVVVAGGVHSSPLSPGRPRMPLWAAPPISVDRGEGGGRAGAVVGGLRLFFRLQLAELCSRLQLSSSVVMQQSWQFLCRLVLHPTLAHKLLVSASSASHVLCCTLFAVCKQNNFFVTWETIAECYDSMLDAQIEQTSPLMPVTKPDYKCVLWRANAAVRRNSGDASEVGSKLMTVDGGGNKLQGGTIGEFYHRVFEPSVSQLLDTVCQRSPANAGSSSGNGSSSLGKK